MVCSMICKKYGVEIALTPTLPGQFDSFDCIKLQQFSVKHPVAKLHLQLTLWQTCRT